MLPSRPTLAALALLLLLPAPAAGLRLAPLADDPQPEGTGLPRAAIFARIDSLEAALSGELSRPERAVLQRRVGELYLATGLAKHRRHALERLGEALELDPASMRAARVRATTAQRMRYPGQARAWLEEMVEAHPGQVEPLLLLGRFHFVEARRRLDEDGFARAGVAYARAARADSNAAEAWYGLATVRLAREQWEAAAAAARRLAGEPGYDWRAALLEGAALAGQGDPDGARARFDAGLAGAPAHWREVFHVGEAFLHTRALAETALRQLGSARIEAAQAAVDPEYEPGDQLDVDRALEHPPLRAEAVRLYWSERQRSPTQLVNARRMRYWRRLVEAELLFGDAERGQDGWEHPMGEAIVRWGRPTSTYYDMGSPGSANLLDELQVAGVRLRPEEVIPEATPIWVWTWRQQDRWFSMLFTDASRSGRWWPSVSSELVARAVAREEPLVFFDEGPLPPLVLQWQNTVFHRGPGRVQLESSIAVALEGVAGEVAASLPGIELRVAIFDADGVRLALSDHLLEADDREAARLAAAGAAVGEGPGPWRLDLRHPLPPGSYRLAVEAGVLGQNERIARQEPLLLPVGPPPGFLELSALQLAGAVLEGTGAGPGLEKFGYRVLPLAAPGLPAGLRTLHVYYEVYNPDVGPDGRTRLRASYEVYRATRELRRVVSQGELDPDGLVRIDPLGATFEELRTGRSAEGFVVKGGQVDVSGLGVGRYLLAVTVEDELRGEKALQVAPFTILP